MRAFIAALLHVYKPEHPDWIVEVFRKSLSEEITTWFHGLKRKMEAKSGGNELGLGSRQQRQAMYARAPPKLPAKTARQNRPMRDPELPVYSESGDGFDSHSAHGYLFDLASLPLIVDGLSQIKFKLYVLL